MRKQLTAVLLILALLLTMSGCSTVNALQKLDAAEESVEEKLDVAEDKLEDSLRKAVSPATAPAYPAETPAETEGSVETQPEPAPPAATEKAQALTQEQAQQIALEYLGFTAEQVTRLRTRYEIDDGIPQFDVEFIQGDWEYEFEIHGETGRILSYDKDHKYD